jgi:hypothetical protein
MISKCEKCALPGIFGRIESSRNAALVANANIRLSSSPTEAKPFQKAATEAVETLRIAEKEYADFLKIWSGFCIKCDFGA